VIGHNFGIDFHHPVWCPITAVGTLLNGKASLGVLKPERTGDVQLVLVEYSAAHCSFILFLQMGCFECYDAGLFSPGLARQDIK
jgi:hypothetical protein